MLGSLGILASGSQKFATDSGSVAVDFATLLPSAIMGMFQFLGTGIAGNITASVGGPTA